MVLKNLFTGKQWRNRHLTLSFPLPMSVSLFSMSISPLLPCK